MNDTHDVALCPTSQTDDNLKGKSEFGAEQAYSLNVRPVSDIRSPDTFHWVGNGFRISSLFTPHDASTGFSDPFLLLDYAPPHYFARIEHVKPSPADKLADGLDNSTHPHEFNTAAVKAHRGVGEHPHKGFETVTIAYLGEVAHRDSAGGGGVIKTGDVQWMTAGSGVVHEEFHSAEFIETGGEFEMVQLWVNLPSSHKLTAPRYQHLTAEVIPNISLHSALSANTDDSTLGAGSNSPSSLETAPVCGSLRVIAGNYNNTEGAAQTFSPMNVWDVQLSPKQMTTLTIPNHHQVLILVRRGTVVINNHHSLAKPADLVRLTTCSQETHALMTHAPETQPSQATQTKCTDIKTQGSNDADAQRIDTDRLNIQSLNAKSDQTTALGQSDTLAQSQLILDSSLSDETVEVLILTGAPLNEPIAAYGPFVMNTQAELREAMNEYRSGKFGTLPVMG